MSIGSPLDLHLLLLALFLGVTSSSAAVFTLHNLCSFTIWPGILSGNSANLGGGGLVLQPGSIASFPAPAGWSGRFWARTGCNFDPSGAGKCSTGDCSGVLGCSVGGSPPATLAEFTLASTPDQKDYYDVSLVDGYNVKLGIQALRGMGDCRNAGCLADLNVECPAELQVVDASGSVVACKSACAAFNSPEYCCTGDHGTPNTCPPTKYSMMFKNACPSAYSYAYDDATSTFTCSHADYYITFCPRSNL